VESLDGQYLDMLTHFVHILYITSGVGAIGECMS